MIARLFLVTAGLSYLCVAQTFEVASIRPSQFQSGDGEGSKRESIDMSADRLAMRNITLRSLHQLGVRRPGFPDRRAPWRGAIRYCAKAAAPATAPALRAMLGTLLAERFN